MGKIIKLHKENQKDDFSDEYPQGGNEEYAGPKGPLSKIPSVKYTIPTVIILCTFSVFTIISSGSITGNYFFVSGTSLFADLEIWRPLTAILVHSDIQHLMSNSLLFIVFGWMLRAYFGFKIFPVASIVIGIIANIITVAFYNPSIRLIGASGMVYGMAAQWLVFYVRFDKNYTISKKIFRAAGFSMALLFPTTVYPNVSYLAHGAGFVTGIIVSIIILPVAEKYYNLLDDKNNRDTGILSDKIS